MSHPTWLHPHTLHHGLVYEQTHLAAKTCGSALLGVTTKPTVHGRYTSHPKSSVMSNRRAGQHTWHKKNSVQSTAPKSFEITGVPDLFLSIRADDQHYIRQEWPLRQGLEPGLHNAKSPPLDEPNKILLPPLHIKLGLMKNFAKAMD